MAAKNEARVKFTAETTEFNQNIKESETKMAALRSELKLNSEQMKTSGVSIEGLEAKHEMLKQVLAESENKTKNLSDKLEAAKRIYEMCIRDRRVITDCTQRKTRTIEIQINFLTKSVGSTPAPPIPPFEGGG